MNNIFDKESIFNPEYTKKIRLVGKIHAVNGFISTDIYLLESHGNKYKMIHSFDNKTKNLATLKYKIDKINDFQNDVVSKWSDANTKYYVPQNENVIITEISPNEIKSNLFDIVNNDGVLKIIDKVDMFGVDYLDFLLKINQNPDYEMDFVNMYLQKTKTFTKFGMVDVRPPFEFADGTTLSIQANKMVYCSPRTDDASFYTSVECRMPSKEIEQLNIYAEDPDELTETVYPYTPVKVLNEIIKEKGISEKTRNIIFDDITR